MIAVVICSRDYTSLWVTIEASRKVISEAVALHTDDGPAPEGIEIRSGPP